MRTIKNYILREYIKLFLITLLALLSVYLLVEFFERVDDFVEHDASISDCIMYFVYKLPLILYQIVPVLMLLPTIITFSLLARNNELTAMKSCGVSLIQASMPVVLMAAAMSAAFLAMGEYLSPWAERRLNYLFEVEIKKAPDVVTSRFDLHFQTGENDIWEVEALDMKGMRMRGISCHVLGPDGQPAERMDAAEARFEDGAWYFYNGRIRRFRQGWELTSEQFDRLAFPLNIDLDELVDYGKKTGEMSFRELLEHVVRLREKGVNPKPAMVDMHARLSYPFSGLVMAFFGIPFSLRNQRSGRVALSVGISIFIGFVFWVLYSLGIALGHAGILPPVVSAWSANLIALFTGLYLILSVQQ